MVVAAFNTDGTPNRPQTPPARWADVEGKEGIDSDARRCKNTSATKTNCSLQNDDLHIQQRTENDETKMVRWEMHTMMPRLG